ncbi:MAG: hypothetical protein AB1424_01955 [Thermodesulfobacteriota bacterium]
MSSPTSSATIEFPFPMIDAEIRNILEREGVRFKPRVFGPILELDDVSGDSLELENPLYDLEVDVEFGIFRLYNGEARYGEFDDLEEMLVEKGIPFDRDSRPDWNRLAELRVYRPGDPPFDLRIPQDEELCSLVHKLREKLSAIEVGAFSEVPGLQEIVNCLDELDPAFPPLADWVKGAAKDKEAA